MPTPLFNFRLSAETARKLRELSVVVNGGNPSALVRDMVEAIVSGDARKIGEFQARLMQKMGEQLALDFVAKAEAEGRKLIAAKRKKGRKGHA